jgi:gamma-glutamylcyclotransferase (GGCT)/AIG2-like uncharacterized protein YtfP
VTITYFAYAANLYIPAMQARCPGAEVLGTATLTDYRLLVMREGWLSIDPMKGDSVAGLLWMLQEDHLAALDAYEDVANGLYERAHLVVESAQGVTAEALVYIGSNAGPGTLHHEYGESVARAAHDVLGEEAAHRIRTLQAS